MTPEKRYSNRIIKKIISKKLKVLRLESLGNGIPDTLVINPDNMLCVFVEYKSDRGKPTLHQQAWENKNPNLVKITLHEKTITDEYALRIIEIFLGKEEE
jgi:hypothetical protein